MKTTKSENQKKIPTRHAAILTLSLVTMFAAQLALAAENESYKKELAEVKETVEAVTYEMPKNDFHDEIEAAIAQVEHQEFLIEQEKIARAKAEAEAKKKAEEERRVAEEAHKKAEMERLKKEQAEKKQQEEVQAEKERLAEAAKKKAEAVDEEPTIRTAASDKKVTANETSVATDTFSATYYTATCAGCSGITAGGTDVRGTIYKAGMRVIAVDPTVIPLGTVVRVTTPYETFTAIADDKGGAIKGKKIDILVSTVGEAVKKGRHQVQIEILK